MTPLEEEETMYERDIDPYEELTDDFCNFLEAHPWHCETRSSPLEDEYRDNGWVHVPDAPDVEDGPYCPIDTLDALELCGRLADDIAHGKPVSRAKAVMAAGQAAKCFAKYEYEQQEWFIAAFEAVTERETKRIGADDTPRDPTADEGLGDKRERKSTT
jgi:hypothetical protein